MRELAERFDKQEERLGKQSVLDNKRAVNRLRKEAVKAKEILSANKDAHVKIPELLDYVTLNTKLSRTDLEEKMKSEIEKVGKPIDRALELASLTIADIDSVELIGGGIRVPKVHEVIQ